MWRRFVVFMGDSEHDLIGKAIKYLLPDEIGYTPQTGGAMTFIDCIENDNVSVIKVVFAQQDGDLFYTEGYNEEVVIRGYKNASHIDRERVQEKIERLGFGENLYLAVNVNQIFDTGMARDFDNFIQLVDDKQIDCKRACQDLNNITRKAAPRRAHAFSVGANLKEGTAALRSFNMYEQMAKGACERAYNYVSDMPGYSETYIDKTI